MNKRNFFSGISNPLKYMFVGFCIALIGALINLLGFWADVRAISLIGFFTSFVGIIFGLLNMFFGWCCMFFKKSK